MIKLFNLSLKINGFPIQKGIKILEDILKIHEEKYQSYLDDRKNYIVNYH